MSNGLESVEVLSHEQIQDLRRRIANGKDYSYQEVRQAIQTLRAQRERLGDSSKAKKEESKQKKGGGGKQQVDLSDLL